MELTKFIIIIVLAVFSVIGSVIMLVKYNTDKRKELDKALLDLRNHTDEEDSKLDKKIGETLDTMLKETSTIKQTIAEIKVKNDLWWDCIKNSVVNMVKTMPTNISKDVLLSKFQKNELDAQEAVELREILQHEKDLPENKYMAWGYVLILAGLAQTIHDLRKDDADGKLSDNSE